MNFRSNIVFAEYRQLSIYFLRFVGFGKTSASLHDKLHVRPVSISSSYSFDDDVLAFSDYRELNNLRMDNRFEKIKLLHCIFFR